MDYYQTFILISLLVLTLIITILSSKMKNVITPMQGMSITMFFSMNIGLTAGVLLGGYLQGNLFQSTILSIVIGVIAGLLCGISFGTISCLEGIMSGLMGGMMGAMLGEMINGEQLIQLVRLFLLLTISTIFLFVIFPNKHNQKTINNKIWLFKPLLLAMIISFYLFVGVSYAENKVNLVSNSSLHNEHTQSKPSEVDDSIEIIIKTADMKYSPSNFILGKNQPVTLILKNEDNIEHDLELKIPNTNKMESGDNHGNQLNQENMIHLHAGPKEEQLISFTPTESGLYEFVCTIPGHKESGMVGWITVN
ncbi:cupredoxin domain-containing protein [Ureibacillus manganicus]|uniref:Blue (type 1) copper domain-containing protein n=1 Tax=Ureibacillus manganicus DSM 26584 TaxID=1384049 RepID=A0A0A3IQQ7_9BACL|nr:plastocyanin/azurin family copper-binding protein [Ureibacillus manganicus]KGR77162.1 hypothetical protein CD29_15820 [Ureibacillus manganicus DSM 26584]